MPEMNLFGRTVIYTNAEEITAENISDVLTQAYSTHQANVTQIDYLYNYYKGNQPIYSREKTIRDDIINIVCENRAKQIVDFKVGYQFSEPVKYISTGINEERATEDIAQLNTWMSMEEVDSKNVEVGEWQSICGTAYKMGLQKENIFDGEAPFVVYVPEPQNTFVIYSSGLGHRPMAGVYLVKNEENETIFNVYTETEYFKLNGTDQIIERGVNGLGFIPIVEYPGNNARLGDFEVVITLLDALNELDSDRVDGVEQFIQSLVIALNCEFEEGQTFSDIVKSGIVSLKSVDGMQQDIKILTEQLNQTQTQTLKDDIISAILQICSMPNRNGGRSTSDTGVAVVYRDGWSAAWTDAKKKEMPFKKSERQFLSIILKICNEIGGLNLTQNDIDIHFDRKNYENIEVKTNVLTALLNNKKVAPRLAFVMSDMFPDAEAAYQESLPYIQMAETAEAESISETEKSL